MPSFNKQRFEQVRLAIDQFIPTSFMPFFTVFSIAPVVAIAVRFCDSPPTSMVFLRQHLQDELLQLVLRLDIQVALCEPQMSMRPPDVWESTKDTLDLQCSQTLVKTHRVKSGFN